MSGRAIPEFRSTSQPSFAFSACLSLHQFSVAKANHPPAAERAGGAYTLAKFALPADHRRAEKVEHFLNRLRDRKRRAARIKQADGTRIPLLVFHHQRARVATGDKRIADRAGHQDLSSEGLGERSSARALILVSHRNGSVEARHP